MKYRTSRPDIGPRRRLRGRPVEVRWPTRWGLCLLQALCALSPLALAAADWPTYRGGPTRSGYVEVEAEVPTDLLWTHHPHQPPRPAWPPPAKQSYWQELDTIEPRVTDDWAFQPVADRTHVYYGSSADDHLWCLDSVTGQVLWSFATDGPIRYAPTLSEGRVLFGSDDGHVYCLDRGDGTLVWKSCCAVRTRLIAGNGRIISAWPVRTGLVVDGGLVYALAGLYPSQGVYAFALRVSDGQVVWKRQVDYSPQGYLLASGGLLYVPTGRGNPIALDRANGKLVQAFDGVGGSFAVVADHELVAGTGNDGSLAVSDIASRDRLVAFEGAQIVVTPETSYLLGNGKLRALDRGRFMQLSRSIHSLTQQRDLLQRQLKKRGPQRRPSETDGGAAGLRGRLGEVARTLDQLETSRQSCWRWTVAAAESAALLATRNLVVSGGRRCVVARRAADGQQVGSHAIDGRALALAWAHGSLLVGTDDGTLYCFGVGGDAEHAVASAMARPPSHADAQRRQPDDLQPRAPRPGPESADRHTQRSRPDVVAQRALEASGRRRGYCLVLGAGDGQLARAIATASEMTVVTLDRDKGTVRRCREALVKDGVYGRRVSVQHVVGDRLPLADQIANLVVSSPGLLDGEAPSGWAAGEIERVTRPYGGTIWVDANRQPTRRGPLADAGRWTHQYGNAANTANSGDRLVERRVELLWLGGPGPRRMVDRHLRGPAPLVEAGRLLIPAENALICVDAYNGTELWQTDLPNSQRYSMPYDAGYMAVEGDRVAVAVGDLCQLIDARTGRCMRRIELPGTAAETPSVWGYTALVNGRLFGTSQRPTASRTTPSRAQIDVDYNNGQPVVTSRAIFCVAADGSGQHWVHRGGVVINSTITIDDKRVYFVASRSARSEGDSTGRLPLADLLAGPAELIALDAFTGTPVWRRPVDGDLRECRNILFLQSTHGLLIATGSRVGADRDSWYQIATFDAASGRPKWHAAHAAGKPDAFTHGEQVHHPAVLGDMLLAEPALYDLATGRRIDVDGHDPPQPFVRSAGGCGTVSAAGHCLFFRAGNPTVTDFSRGLAPGQRTHQLAPNRPGCWINIIPAGGLIIIPEASAGCVCHYSLQTSMALAPAK